MGAGRRGGQSAARSARLREGRALAAAVRGAGIKVSLGRGVRSKGRAISSEERKKIECITGGGSL